MIQTLVNRNKQMRYQVVLLIQLNDVQQSMKSAKTNEITMDTKHASACAWDFSFSLSFFLSFFISYLFFSFEQVATESK
jgi:hypothetical protein